MIGRRLVPPTSSKGSKDMQINSNQVKSAESRKQQQIWKEAEIKEQAWSPMASPTPSWSELSLYWSEGSVSSRSQSLSSHSFSFLLSFGDPSLPCLSHQPFLSSDVLQSRPSPPPCRPPHTYLKFVIFFTPTHFEA